MKIGILFSLIGLIPGILNPDEAVFQKLDYETVILRLFDDVKFNSKQEALWKPNFAERLNMPVSDDGFCHTVLDTTLYFTSENEKQAVIIFATYQYLNNDRNSCHACSPMLSIASFKQEDKKNWRIEQFKKDFIELGAWGEMQGHIGIEKLGKDFCCLIVQTAIDGNLGYESGLTSLYSLDSYDQFHEVFSFVYYDSNEGARGDRKGFTDRTTMSIIPTSDDYFDIELNTKSSKGNNMIIKKYKYSKDERHYIHILK